MPRGRRPGPGTAEEKAAARREKVRLNVQAYRKRKHAAEKDHVKCDTKDSDLKWVEDTKWQHEYEQRVRPDQPSDTDADDEHSKTSAVSTPSRVSDVGDNTSTELIPVVQTPQMYNTPALGKQNSLR